ncbi:MAG: glycosyltransferase family 9 protein [Proteobacteria bacterium]|nr:glycosyltransferase family 9 protein [Pseudomonadota bacterium]
MSYTHQPYIGLAPGAGGRHKCWPLENYINLANDLYKKGFIPVVLLGPAEQEWTDQCQSLVKGALFPLQKTSSALLTIAVAKKLSLGIGNDSGITHLMATSHIPILALYGPTSHKEFVPQTPTLYTLTAQEFSGRDMKDIPYKAVFEKTLILYTQKYHRK